MSLTGFMALGGCASVPSQAPPRYEPGVYGPVHLDARKLDIVESWQMPMTPPYIEHTLSPNLSSMVVDWAKNVMRPAGGSGEFVVDIIQASVTITDLPKSTSLLDVLSDQPESKIRVEIRAKLMWIQPVGGKQAIADVNATATSTISELASPNTHDVVIRQTMLEAIDFLDAEARRQVAMIANLVRP